MGCGASELSVEAGAHRFQKKEQGEAWSSADNPALFTASLERRLSALPSSGEAANIPWAGSYWPVYEDSINYRWDGPSSDSPALKYEKAYGLSGIEAAVSKHSGVESQSARKACSDSSECDAKLGETCAKRLGAESGRCIPTWFGLCHAWAPASILVPEPRKPVTVNGVTFKVQDLKALVTLVHDRTTQKFVSLRCFEDLESNEVPFDAEGRPTSACRDTNPGTYHLLLANYLGKLKQSFVEDRTFDDEVWNQPLRAFRVLEQRSLDAAEANELLGASFEGARVEQATGAVAQDEWAAHGPFEVAPGDSLRIRMSGSGDGDLYVRFDASPTATAYDCRPYQGGSAEECSLTAPAGASVVHVSVHGYAESSYALSVAVGGTARSTYAFNAQARAFELFTTEVDYITEATSSTDGNLGASIDRYTKTDRYQYLLELDAEGKVIGGEWVGDSRTNHPDFLWLPTGPARTSVAGVDFDKVKALLDESVRDEQGEGGAPRKVEQAGTVAKGELDVFGPFQAGAGEFAAVLTGTGDADLYVRRGAPPTSSSYDCRPYVGGSSESCRLTGPETFYVGVRGYAATSNYSLVVTYLTASSPPSPEAPRHLDLMDSVTGGQLKVYTLVVKPGEVVRITATTPQNIDLYAQLNAAPTLTSFLKRTYGNTLLVSTPSGGTLHIGVYGREASSFRLTTATEP